MTSCEKCWKDSHDWSGDQPYRYQQLIKERKDNPCAPEEQVGENAKECLHCHRKTVHQYCLICMVCARDYE